jgi:hypothetical protein
MPAWVIGVDHRCGSSVWIIGVDHLEEFALRPLAHHLGGSTCLSKPSKGERRRRGLVAVDCAGLVEVMIRRIEDYTLTVDCEIAPPVARGSIHRQCWPWFDPPVVLAASLGEPINVVRDHDTYKDRHVARSLGDPAMPEMEFKT